MFLLYDTSKCTRMYVAVGLYLLVLFVRKGSIIGSSLVVRDVSPVNTHTPVWPLLSLAICSNILIHSFTGSSLMLRDVSLVNTHTFICPLRSLAIFSKMLVHCFRFCVAGCFIGQSPHTHLPPALACKFIRRDSFIGQA